MQKKILFGVLILFSVLSVMILNHPSILLIQSIPTDNGFMLNCNSWEHNGTVICTADNSREYLQICEDTEGGAVMTWEDHRSGSYDIYTQRITAAGVISWMANGTAICTLEKTQYRPQICSDMTGGAIIAWLDERNPPFSPCFDLYAQHINAAGAVTWTENGTAICALQNIIYAFALCSDGAGGAIITWCDNRSGPYDLYAQRINATGAVLWTANGIAICTAIDEQVWPKICSDGIGGAIIAWGDKRNGNSDIYTQRITATGAVLWPANGIAICTAKTEQVAHKICSDMAGGAIITWDDYNGFYYDIYAQRINATGAVLWAGNGTAICTAINDQYYPEICSDGVGGAIITWYDWRNGNPDIYAQRIAAAGIVSWTANGIAICTAINIQYTPLICSDSVGGAIITWSDRRFVSNDFIYAQRITAAGAILWEANGIAINTLTITYEIVICNDGAIGAIIAWCASPGNIYVSITPRPPNAPQLKVLNTLGTKVLLNWMAIVDAAVYYIYRNNSEITDISGLVPLKTTTTNYTTDEISVAGTYYYVIVASNIYGNSTISNCQVITVVIEQKNDGIPGFGFISILIAFLPVLIPILFGKFLFKNNAVFKISS